MEKVKSHGKNNVMISTRDMRGPLLGLLLSLTQWSAPMHSLTASRGMVGSSGFRRIHSFSTFTARADCAHTHTHTVKDRVMLYINEISMMSQE